MPHFISRHYPRTRLPSRRFASSWLPRISLLLSMIWFTCQWTQCLHTISAATFVKLFSKTSRIPNMWRSGHLGWMLPCALERGTCNCTGTVVLSTLLGNVVWEINADGKIQCGAEALGAPVTRGLKVCWCQSGISWGDGVRKGLASMLRQGLAPRVEIASDQLSLRLGCNAETDGLWHGCVLMSKRWDATVLSQVLLRTTALEEQLDMTLRKLDACHRLNPWAALRVLGVRSGQAVEMMEIPVASALDCSVVYHPNKGAVWTAKTDKLQCATQPGRCTTTPCDCTRMGDHKLELFTPQGRRCWACAQPGHETFFRVNALAEQLQGGSTSWWPPYGIHCPPILWFCMDWRSVVQHCPVLSTYLVVLLICLIPRKIEEVAVAQLPWTRIIPLFGPTLKRGEVWRLFTYTFFHIHFMDVFQSFLTLVDTLDVEATPPIILGDGSNLKCGYGVKQNFMCYPSIGIGSVHTLGVAIISTMVGGMCSTWIHFGGVTTGASALGFGLSGAIVALYALYAGADLDQAINVQRSFQDWVWLRLIFVGFHVGMECVRSFSQKDLSGLFAHTAAFSAGFAYVLYFCPAMGDGSTLPSDRPYVVPCASEVHETGYATAQMSECIRLFSHVYEYPVSVIKHNVFALFVAVTAATAFNVVVMQRQTSSSECVLLAGCEVSAICCARKALVGNKVSSSMLNGKDILIWVEVINATHLRLVQEMATRSKLLFEVRCFSNHRRRAQGSAVNTESDVAKQTRLLEWGSRLSINESLFLPTKFSKESSVQIVLREFKDGRLASIAQVTMSMPQALTLDQNGVCEKRLPLRPIPGEVASALDASSTQVHLRFKLVDAKDLLEIKQRVMGLIGEDREKATIIEHHIAQMERHSTGSDLQS